MVVIETGYPTKINLKELPVKIPFKYMNEEKYNTYIKMSDSIVCLNTGEASFVEEEDVIVQAYKDIKIITNPMTKSIEISKIDTKRLNRGGCCIYEDTIYIKTDIEKNSWNVMFNLETKSFQPFKANDKVLPAPFLCLELV